MLGTLSRATKIACCAMLANMQPGELRQMPAALNPVQGPPDFSQSAHFDPRYPSERRVQPRISVAIPVYNEEAVVPELIRRVTSVLDMIPGGPHELVLVDDGSSDRTLNMLERAVQKDPRIVVVALSRNFGHQSALTAALDHV